MTLFHSYPAHWALTVSAMFTVDGNWEADLTLSLPSPAAISQQVIGLHLLQTVVTGSSE